LNRGDSSAGGKRGRCCRLQPRRFAKGGDVRPASRNKEGGFCAGGGGSSGAMKEKKRKERRDLFWWEGIAVVKKRRKENHEGHSAQPTKTEILPNYLGKGKGDNEERSFRRKGSSRKEGEGFHSLTKIQRCRGQKKREVDLSRGGKRGKFHCAEKKWEPGGCVGGGGGGGGGAVGIMLRGKGRAAPHSKKGGGKKKSNAFTMESNKKSKTLSKDRPPQGGKKKGPGAGFSKRRGGDRQ